MGPLFLALIRRCPHPVLGTRKRECEGHPPQEPPACRARGESTQCFPALSDQREGPKQKNKREPGPRVLGVSSEMGQGQVGQMWGGCVWPWERAIQPGWERGRSEGARLGTQVEHSHGGPMGWADGDTEVQRG